jgi:hypothetical protein
MRESKYDKTRNAAVNCILGAATPFLVVKKATLFGGGKEPGLRAASAAL